MNTFNHLFDKYVSQLVENSKIQKIPSLQKNSIQLKKKEKPRRQFKSRTTNKTILSVTSYDSSEFFYPNKKTLAISWKEGKPATIFLMSNTYSPKKYAESPSLSDRALQHLSTSS